MSGKRYKQDKGTGKMAGSKARYETPQELYEAAMAYFNNPPLRQVHYKHDIYNVPAMTIEDVAKGLGWKTKQSMYDTEKRGDDWAEVINAIRDELCAYWVRAGEHGNAPHAKLMLVNLGYSDKQELDHTSSDGSMSPKGKSLDDFYKDADDECSS